jgi:hypothetical protein
MEYDEVDARSRRTSCIFRFMHALFYHFTRYGLKVSFSGTKVAKTMLSQLCVLCGVVLHNLYILTAMPTTGRNLQQPRPPPAHTTPNTGSAHEQKESSLELFQVQY